MNEQTTTTTFKAKYFKAETLEQCVDIYASWLKATEIKQIANFQQFCIAEVRPAGVVQMNGQNTQQIFFCFLVTYR